MFQAHHNRARNFDPEMNLKLWRVQKTEKPWNVLEFPSLGRREGRSAMTPIVFCASAKP